MQIAFSLLFLQLMQISCNSSNPSNSPNEEPVSENSPPETSNPVENKNPNITSLLGEYINEKNPNIKFRFRNDIEVIGWVGNIVDQCTYFINGSTLVIRDSNPESFDMYFTIVDENTLNGPDCDDFLSGFLCGQYKKKETPQ